MSWIDKEIKSVWNDLRASQPHWPNSLNAITIRNMRGISELRVPFGYPVTVLAGANACGKSTVLFGCAAAYKAPGTSKSTFYPAKLFPSFSIDNIDAMAGIELEYAYLDQGRSTSMIWKRGKSWNKSFLGRKGSSQPERDVYLRTLANLTNPSEVRSMLQIHRRQRQKEQVPPELLLLSRQVLASKYDGIEKVSKSKGRGDLLLATLEGNDSGYSEFHMASGERSMLRLSMEISGLKDALVLIDEIETGLHPHIQKLLMFNLQRMAVRQRLQIIVTTHSPVVLNYVPSDARVFLSRDSRTQNVSVLPPLRDVLQKAMYGQSSDKFSILCEDHIAEAVIRGVIDALNETLDFHQEHVAVGRDTGKDEFPNHARVLAKVGELSDFVFVLDGDAHTEKDKLEKVIKELPRSSAKVFVLPGKSCPEEWLWGEIKRDHKESAAWLEVGEDQLRDQVEQTELELSDATGQPNFKIFLIDLAANLTKTPSDIARKVARQSARRGVGGIIDFMADLQSAITEWRSS